MEEFNENEWFAEQKALAAEIENTVTLEEGENYDFSEEEVAMIDELFGGDNEN